MSNRYSDIGRAQLIELIQTYEEMIETLKARGLEITKENINLRVEVETLKKDYANAQANVRNERAQNTRNSVIIQDLKTRLDSINYLVTKKD